MKWCIGKIRETKRGFRAALTCSTQRHITRLYKDSSSARSMAKQVAAKLGWQIDWKV